MVVSMLDNVLSISSVQERSQPRVPEAAKNSASAERPVQPASRSADQGRFDQHYAAAQRDQAAVTPLRKESVTPNSAVKNGKESPQASSSAGNKSDQTLPLEGSPVVGEPLTVESLALPSDKLPSDIAITIDILQSPSGKAEEVSDEGSAETSLEGNAATLLDLAAEDGDDQAKNQQAEPDLIELAQTADVDSDSATTEPDAIPTRAEPQASTLTENTLAELSSEQPDSSTAAQQETTETLIVDEAELIGNNKASTTQDGEPTTDPTLGMSNLASSDAERAGQTGVGQSSTSDTSGGGRATAPLNSALTAAVAEQTVVNEQTTLRQPLDVAAARESSARLDTEALIKQHLERELPVRHSSTDVTHRLSERLVMMVSRDIQQATIRLDPPELGKMDIQIRTNGDQVQVQVVTQQPMVRDLLEQQAFRLREMLEQQGFAKVDVNVSDQSQREREQAQQGQSREGEALEDGERSEQAALVRETVGLVDHYV